MHYRMVSIIPGLYPLDGNGTLPPVVTTKKCIQTLLNVPWGTTLPPLLRTTGEDSLELHSSNSNVHFGGEGESIRGVFIHGSYTQNTQT